MLRTNWSPATCAEQSLTADPLKMTLKNIYRLQTALLCWYQQNHRKLPWRETKNPYRIWVSEVMLQQTQVKTVVSYYQNFIRQFPTIKKLAEAELQSVLKAWEGMGYYARARNLLKAAHIIIKEHDGKIPKAYNDIHSLPGVGDYIAAAVLSIAYKKPHAVVDGNVKRVLARLLCVKEAVNVSSFDKLFQAKATALLEKNKPDIFNQAMMELGALVCKPKTPECTLCPLTKYCCAFIKDVANDYPKRVKRTKTPTYHVAVGVIFKKGRMLITQRKPDGLLGGLWEFPGGKIKKKERAEDACLREIKEETNITVNIIKQVAKVRHAYTHFKIVMDVFCCKHQSGRVKRNGPVAHRWIRMNEIEKYPFPKANHKFFDALKIVKDS
jgi:A/G-specific adenine glycosylase